MNKDDSYWLKVSYVLFWAITGYTFWKALGTLGIQTGWSDRYDWYSIAATAGAVGLGLGATYLIGKSKERHDYFLAAIQELRKVTWPSMPDTRRMTLIVCVVVGIFAVILAVFDLVWAKILGLLIA